MTRNKYLPGFDYRAGTAVTLTRGEWRERLGRCVASGGFRRVEHGETFGHGADGLVVFEVYANLPAPRVAS